MQAIQKVLEAVGAIFFVEMKYDFGIGVRMKTMRFIFAFEFTAEIGEVVYLAVIGNPHGAIFVRHGHVAIGGKVENGKTATAQCNVSAIGEMPLPEAGVVGPPVHLHVGHAGQCLPVAAIHEAADAAHGLSSSPSLVRTSARTFSPLCEKTECLAARSKS